MSSNGKSLADHPVIVLVGLFLAVLGGLAAVNELTGSTGSSPPSTSQKPPPSVLDEATSPTGTSTAGQPSPRTEKTSVAPPEEKEKSTAEQTDTPPAPEEHQPSHEPEPEPAQHKGSLTVRIEMGRTGQVGPNEWRAGVRPGANTVVYDMTGRLDTRCYVQWTLKHEGEVVQLHRSGRCRPPSITMFNFDEQLETGTYTLAADVRTDWGQTGSKTVQFGVSPS